MGISPGFRQYDLLAQMADDLIHEQDDRRTEALSVVDGHDGQHRKLRARSKGESAIIGWSP
jgi:hypothetical protein